MIVHLPMKRKRHQKSAKRFPSLCVSGRMNPSSKHGHKPAQITASQVSTQTQYQRGLDPDEDEIQYPMCVKKSVVNEHAGSNNLRALLAEHLQEMSFHAGGQVKSMLQPSALVALMALSGSSRLSHSNYAFLQQAVKWASSGNKLLPSLSTLYRRLLPALR